MDSSGVTDAAEGRRTDSDATSLVVGMRDGGGVGSGGGDS